jgi:hypothetical protein
MSHYPLSDRQRRQLEVAAGLLSPSRRADFLRSCENRLKEMSFVTGGALRETITTVLSAYGCSAPYTNEENNGK